jgi:hypothetical protein
MLQDSEAETYTYEEEGSCDDYERHTWTRNN